MKIWVYIDGFNLYNGAVKNTDYKWLDLLKLSQHLRPSDSIERIKYFTAKLDTRSTDTGQPFRQMIYWRALETLGLVEIIKGKFLTKPVYLPEAASVDELNTLKSQGANTAGMRPNMVKVYRSEEKGTDVNLAVHMVHDAHLAKFDAALVLSNDSDLVEAVRIVVKEIGKPVFIYTPHAKFPSAQLKSVATSFFDIRTIHLSSSLFPNTLTDVRGTFSKTSAW